MSMDKDNIPLTGPTESVKMEIDYSAECDVTIPKAEETAQSGKLVEAIDILLALEKQTRTGGDMISTGRVLVTIVQLCFKAKDWPALKDNVNLLARRRGQLKQAVVKMVQEVCLYIDELPTKDLKYDMIDTLRSVTEGKIYVECERARLTYKLAKMREEEGAIALAADILQELQVETYGSMEKKEKVELILEQMRYCLAKNDYIRTQIISKKINVKFYEDEAQQELKLKYYDLMIKLDQHEGSYLSICRHIRAIINTPCIQENEAKKKENYRAAILYLILSPYNNEQFDLLHRMLEEKALESIVEYKTLLGLFKNQELINWKNLCKTYEARLRSNEQTVFENSELGLKRWKHLKDRVVEHNIRIMAKYYTKVSLRRMSQLLDLEQDEVEKVLCDMIVAGTICGKADRVAGIVSFQSAKDPSERLNDWSQDLNNLMSLLTRTTHLINKEEMVHKHLLGPSEDVKETPSTSETIKELSTPMEVEG